MEQGAATRMESLAVVLFVWILQCSLGTSFEGCESPQYLQYRRSGVIHCSFTANTVAVFWYDSPDIIFNAPIVTLIDSVKGGQGYQSGEFDITSNGSLLISEVNSNHGKNFSVVTFISLDDEPSVYFVVVFIAGVQSDGCDSPQYLEYGGTGIINCRFETNFYGAFWYNSTETVFDQPILTYTQSVKGGDGYESGEFDIFPNGSLIVRGVRLVHEHTYTVAKFTSVDEEPTFFAVVVIVTVKSPFQGPVIDQCEDVDSICFIQLEGYSEVGCTVHGARPAVSLKWLTLTGYGDRNISYEVNLINRNISFTSRVTTSEDFKHTPILSLLVCKAEFVPGVLQRDESLALVQNKFRNLSSAPPVVKYAQRDSPLELHCTADKISFLAWKRNMPLTNSYQNIAFAIFIEHHVVTKYEDHFELGENGSLILRPIDLSHDSFYCCIYGDGLTDGMVKYKVTTYVKPVPVHPVVKGCNYQENCVLEVYRSGTLTCSVNGIRPVVNLEWKVSHETHSGSISFFDHISSVITSSGEIFNITLTSSYSVESVKQMAVECGVSGPEGDIFPEKSGVQLLFLPDLTEQAEHSTFPTIILVIGLIVVAVFLLAIISMICLRKETVPENNHQNVSSGPRDVRHTNGGQQDHITIQGATHQSPRTSNSSGQYVALAPENSPSICTPTPSQLETSSNQVDEEPGESVLLDLLLTEFSSEVAHDDATSLKNPDVEVSEEDIDELAALVAENESYFDQKDTLLRNIMGYTMKKRIEETLDTNVDRYTQLVQFLHRGWLEVAPSRKRSDLAAKIRKFDKSLEQKFLIRINEQVDYDIGTDF